MKMKIWFDMDGTIADLYGVENWLPMLIASDPTPYAVAAPLLRLATLARELNKVQRAGHEIGIISWLSKSSTPEYDEAVTAAKLAWLAKHLPSVRWNEVKIVAYGTSKITECGGGILFDDEDRNRNEWGEGAYEPSQILNILKGLVA